MTALAVKTPLGGPSLLSSPQAVMELLGLLIAFGAIPRMVFGPVLLVIEGVTFLLVRGSIARAPCCGDVDGPRSAKHVRAAFGGGSLSAKRLSLIGQSLRIRLTSERYCGGGLRPPTNTLGQFGQKLALHCHLR